VGNRKKDLKLMKVLYSYNRYISVASRVVRRSLKDDKRIAAEKRGESELRFAKWEVSFLFFPRDGNWCGGVLWMDGC
jgi:hypothetical protein